MFKKEYKALLETSRKELIETYYGLVDAVVNKYLRSRPQLEYLRDEMYSQSSEALIKAIDTYDPKKQATIDTWINRVILQDIRHLVRDEITRSSSLWYIDDVDILSTEDNEEEEVNKYEGLLDYLEARLSNKEVELLHRGIIGTESNAELMKDLGITTSRGVRYAKKALKEKIKEMLYARS